MCRGLRDFLQFICDIVQAIHLSGKRHHGDHVLRKIAYDCDSFFVIIFFSAQGFGNPIYVYCLLKYTWFFLRLSASVLESSEALSNRIH